MPATDPSLHDQLIAARKAIRAQLAHMELSRRYPVAWWVAPPDYAPQVALLTEQLHDLDAILGPDEDS